MNISITSLPIFIIIIAGYLIAAPRKIRGFLIGESIQSISS
jgi:hypothetical protein